MTATGPLSPSRSPSRPRPAPRSAGFPPVVCLCGSTRFYAEFQQANYDLTMRGEIVLSVGFYPHAAERHGHGEGVGHDSAAKAGLDELHKRKIDLADYVLVLNVGGYIGESTRSEIAYAAAHGKPVRYITTAAAASAGCGEPGCSHPGPAPCEGCQVNEMRDFPPDQTAELFDPAPYRRNPR